MVVIYAEKHSLAKTIAEALNAGKRHASPDNPTIAHWEFDFNGEKAILCHGAGHLAELIPAKGYDEKYAIWDLNTFPCVPDNMEIKAKSTAIELLNYISPFFHSADWIINATDPDREGELIFDFVTELIFGELPQMHKPWKRVILPDLTNETIRYAFANLKDSSEMVPLQLAGRARNAADWLVGCNLTIAMTKKFGSKDNLLSVGRVQTPTLALVVKREDEIKNHVKKPFYKVVGNFAANNESFTADYDGGKLEDKTEAEKIKSECDNQTAVITEKSVSNESQSAPLLFNATSLLAEASKSLGWTLEKTTKIMQKLYEGKLMSYPRTSSECLAEQQMDEVAHTIEMLLKLPELQEYAIPRSQWSEFTKRHFDNSKVGSHTAIIPTKSVPSNLSALDEDEKALYVLIAKSLIAIVFPKTEIEKTKLKIAVGKNSFSCLGKRIINLGWQILKDIDDNPNEEEKTLPYVNMGDELSASFEITAGETQPPKRFTEATLILTMEAAGSKLEDKEAVELMKAQKKGLGTDATRAAIINSLFDKKYISKKGKSIFPTAKGIFLINTLAVPELKSAEITGTWEKRLNDIAESKENARSLYTSFISDIKRQVYVWYNIVKESDGVQYFSENESRLVCPLCGKRMFKGKYGYSCTGYTDGCTFHINYEICGKKITESQAAMLCQSGKTAIIKGFKGKSGKVFDASLVLSDGKISFSFNNSKGGK